MTEREMIDEAQRLIGALKAVVRDIEVLNRDAGRDLAANAAMGLRGDLLRWHSNATEALYDHHPDIAGDVVAQGPGGR